MNNGEKAVLFAWLALSFDLAPAHLISCASLLVGWLVAFHLLRGDVTWDVADGAALMEPILTAATGHALIPLIALFGAVAFGWVRAGRSQDAKWYAYAALGATALSLGFLTAFGFGRAGGGARAKSLTR